MILASRSGTADKVTRALDQLGVRNPGPIQSGLQLSAAPPLAHGLHVRNVIATRRYQPLRSLDHGAYRQRNVFERCVSRLKEARRIATRYEKPALRSLKAVTLRIPQAQLKILSNTG
jgi:hypothetical protein